MQIHKRFMENFLSTDMISFFVCFFCLFFLSFRAMPAPYGGSQARDLIGTVAAGLCQSHSNARATAARDPSATYTTPHRHAGSLTH